MRYFVYSANHNIFLNGYDSLAEIHSSRYDRKFYLIVKATTLSVASKIADSILGSNY